MWEVGQLSHIRFVADHDWRHCCSVVDHLGREHSLDLLAMVVVSFDAVVVMVGLHDIVVEAVIVR